MCVSFCQWNTKLLKAIIYMRNWCYA